MKLLQTHKNLVPLLFLAGLCIYTVLVTFFDKLYIEGEYYNRTFTIPHYLAFAAVGIDLLIYFLNRRLFRTAIFLTLALGLFNVLNFTPPTMNVSIGQLSMQPVSLVVVIAYYFLNKSSARHFIRTYLLPTPTPQKRAAASRERVAKFKETFAKKSDANLLEMVQSQTVVPDAVEAARQLLQERGVEQVQQLH